MKTFFGRLQEDRRLVILRVLAEQNDYVANSSVLVHALNHFGHSVSRDWMRTQLHWLAEQSLVVTDDIGPVLVAKLTERGHDVARGHVLTPGISRPGA